MGTAIIAAVPGLGHLSRSVLHSNLGIASLSLQFHAYL